jgi:RNA polymerase sigma factor (sigma-70 family)
MHQPKNADIAEELGISVQDVDLIINITTGPLPLEPDIRKNTAAAAIDTHEHYTYSPERHLLKQFSRDDTLRILDNLKEQEKRVLSYRYQLDGCECRTLREIGTKLNIARETVKKKKKRALKKIRNHAGELKECL